MANWEEKQDYVYEDTIYDTLHDKYLNKEEFLGLVQSDPGRTLIVEMPARKKWLPYWLNAVRNIGCKNHRKQIARSSQPEWKPSPNRRDPIKLIQAIIGGQDEQKF